LVRLLVPSLEARRKQEKGQWQSFSGTFGVSADATPPKLLSPTLIIPPAASRKMPHVQIENTSRKNTAQMLVPQAQSVKK
jgi:hypothetical protein